MQRAPLPRLVYAATFAAVLAGAFVLARPTARAGERAAPSPEDVAVAVDRVLAARLEAEGATPAPRAGDAELLRRVSLDLVGTVPTADEAAAYLADGRPDKYARKVEELLASPAYADHWGVWWFKTLTGLSPGAPGARAGQNARLVTGRAGEVFLDWLEDQAAAERPYDEFVEALLTATGRTDENGATGFVARWQDPNNLAGATAKTFLGLRIQCAQCHDHVYEESWKQSDFQGMAAFFATLQTRRTEAYRELRQIREELQRRRQADRGDGGGAMDGDAADGGAMDGGAMDGPGQDASGDGEPSRGRGRRGRDAERYADASTQDLRRRLRELGGSRLVVNVTDTYPDSRSLQRARRRLERLAESARLPPQARDRIALAAVTPKLWQDAEAPDLPGIARRYLLARWITSDENPYFAPALVNRFWGHFLGLGFVNPVDDFSSVNEPSHPEVLGLLARDFRANGYDLKRLIRVIVMTDAYRRTSRGAGAGEPAPELFAKAVVRPLETEQLYLSLLRATGVEARLDRASRAQSRRMQRVLLSAFSFVFDDDEGLEEDAFAGSIPQGLFLLNGQLLQQAVGARRGTYLAEVLRTERDDAARLRRLYLAAYAREPRSSETDAALRFVEGQDGAPEAWEDLFWALLNSAEFMTNH